MMCPTHTELNNVQIKLTEYQMAQDMLKHYDLLNWQIGSILLGGILIMTGVAINGAVDLPPNISFIGKIVFCSSFPIISWFILNYWCQWINRHRALYDIRIESMQRIELQLNMYHWLSTLEVLMKDYDEKKLSKNFTVNIKKDTAMSILERARQYSNHNIMDDIYYDRAPFPTPSGHKIARKLKWFIPISQSVALFGIVFFYRTPEVIKDVLLQIIL